MLLAGLQFIAKANTFIVESIKYNIISEEYSKVEVVENSYSGNIIIPSSVKYQGKDYSIHRIASEAFKDCINLTSVTLSDGLFTIQTKAFSGCSSLNKITLPKSLDSIEDFAFEGCSSLKELYIPEFVFFIGKGICNSCNKLISLSVSDQNSYYSSVNGSNIIVKKIGNMLVAGCTNSIITNEVNKIDEYAFYGITALKSITIPANITHIEENAFTGCSNLSDVYLNTIRKISLNDNAFDTFGKLHVIKGYKHIISTFDGWNMFNIVDDISVETEATESIDLGLSVKWCNKNVGAERVELYGGLYAWGETVTKESYTWNNYKYCQDGSYHKLTKYNSTSAIGIVDNLQKLQSEDDAATANLGSEWRTPTYEEQLELKDKCVWEYCDGVKKRFNETCNTPGYKVTGPNGNSIYLPMGGYYYNMRYQSLGFQGFYMSSTLDKSGVLAECSFPLIYFDSGMVFKGGDFRYAGYSVRAVTTSTITNIKEYTNKPQNNIKKSIRNNRLTILRNGKKYDITGIKIDN